MRSRGFEVAKGFEDKNINLPERKTKFSAGYDIEAAEDIVIPKFIPGMKPTLVKTGIKAYMMDDEVLYLYNRSSNPKKKGLVLRKDDFYERNEGNETNIIHVDRMHAFRGNAGSDAGFCTGSTGTGKQCFCAGTDAGGV